jgi:nitrogen fixation protein NifX
MTARRLRLVDDATDAKPTGGGRMKVALATQDMKTVNAHFNGAKNMAVYDVGKDGYSFVEVIQFDNLSAEDGKHTDDGEDRIRSKVRALEGISLLFVKAIGGPAAARVVQSRIHPMKIPNDEPITEVLERVRTMLNGNPPPWLRKLMMEETGEKRELDFLDDDEDDMVEETV